jgi:hypothetical protein
VNPSPLTSAFHLRAGNTSRKKATSKTATADLKRKQENNNNKKPMTIITGNSHHRDSR